MAHEYSAGFSTIDDIKEASESSGRNWFSKESMDFDGSVVETEVIGRFYFVESTYVVPGDPDSARQYRGVRAGPDGVLQYLSGGDPFTTLDSARAYIDTEINS